MDNVYLSRFGWPSGADNDPGALLVCMRGSGAIKVGDVVGLSTVGLVAIGTSITTAAMGVCVGGIENGSPAIYGPGSIGHAFADGDMLFIAVGGVAFVPAEGTIVIGDRLIPGTSTAGTAKAGTTAGAIIGKALTASAVSSTIMVLLSRS